MRRYNIEAPYEKMKALTRGQKITQKTLHKFINALEIPKEVKQKFNHEEINYHILGHYDAMMIILNAISKGNFTSEQLKKYLEEMQEYKGVTSDIKFDTNGGVILPLGLYTVKDKQFVKLILN